MHLLILLLSDTDECQVETHNCHMNATCADVIGSFVCTCNSGFEGDGVNCVGKTQPGNPDLLGYSSMSFLSCGLTCGVFFLFVQISMSV